ncbi:hypothetical protein GOB83_12630 [Acetobacter fabarum]|uniref:hypothetical protein n=1 Tax=Acetobacter fabarum TaxID=483199 RepID=UPI001404F42D|nr:hypothetical protein [Acetobacter fabarum]NHO43012.1 hypothetical protein [Acetobacter fabarum]
MVRQTLSNVTFVEFGPREMHRSHPLSRMKPVRLLLREQAQLESEAGEGLLSASDCAALRRRAVRAGRTARTLLQDLAA